MELRAVIPEFPNYEVSNLGRVYKISSGRELTLSEVTGGALSVGMILDGYQYRRQVKTLVARAFVEGETAVFDTPVLLDCNKRNLHADNIVWRPRWFSWFYGKQFDAELRWYDISRVVDSYGYEYRSIREAAMMNGVLCHDIFRSVNEGWRVFPTGQTFEYI